MWGACIGGAYLVGSIPFGVLIGRAKGIDIRQHGSRNVGATNVGRVLGRRLGLVCFFLDLLKGAVPVLVAGFAGGMIGREPTAPGIGSVTIWLWLAVASAAVTGHMASVFLGFDGGKGVATGFGAMLAMWPLLTFPALGALLVWYAVLRLTRYVSLASMLAAVSVPLWYLAWTIPRAGPEISPSLGATAPPLIATTALACLVVWRHRANVGRLRRGQEPKAGS